MYESIHRGKTTYFIHTCREDWQRYKSIRYYLWGHNWIWVLVKENFGLPVLTLVMTIELTVCVIKKKRNFKDREKLFCPEVMLVTVVHRPVMNHFQFAIRWSTETDCLENFTIPSINFMTTKILIKFQLVFCVFHSSNLLFIAFYPGFFFFKSFF